MSPGWGEWLLIAAVVLLLFGAKRLPELARGLGESIKVFKKSLKEGDPPAKADAEPPAKGPRDSNPGGGA